MLFPDFAVVPGTDVAVYDLYGVVAERGSTGDHVTNIQMLLQQQGLDVNVTGVFDLKTENAVRAYEESQGMRETGKVTNALLRILQQRSVIPTYNEILNIPGQVRLPDGTIIQQEVATQKGMSTGAKAAIFLLVLAALGGGFSS